MNIKFENVLPKNYKAIIQFYAKYSVKSYKWYNQKLKKGLISGKIIGKIAINKTNNKIIGAYIGRIQNLLSNPSLKAVQSIDTLISPAYRGGKVLINLSREFYEFLKVQNFDCVYGLPNEKIKKFRYKFLKWNFSKFTYTYYVFIPVLVLRLLYTCANLVGIKKIFNYSNKNIHDLKFFLFLNENCIENRNIKGIYWVSHESSYFTNIGLCRTGKNLSISDKLYLLMIMSLHAKSLFLRTYGTEESETTSIFSPFSIKKKALEFSGRILKNDGNIIFKEQFFEFVEFDNFGLE
jgi:hypothetical protein